MTPANANASAIVKTDWDSLPLGEDLSHLCGGKNRHKATHWERENHDLLTGTPSPADERRMALEWLSDTDLG